MNNKIIRWQCVPSQPFDENTYIAFAEGEHECVIIDPGFEPEKVLAAVAAAELTPVAILNTHGHSDHIAGNAAMKERWPDIPLIIGQGDAEKLIDPQQNLSATYGIPLVSPAADRTVLAGEHLQFGSMELSVRDTPGHSAGHVVFVCQQNDPVVVFGGDVLFAGSIGRTDFPDGDHQTLLNSVRQQLFTLPEETIVLPGHGPATTVGQERRTNPFVGDGR